MNSSTVHPFPDFRLGRTGRAPWSSVQRLRALVVGAPTALAVAIAIHPEETADAGHSLHLIGDSARTRWILAHLLEPLAWLAIAVVLALVTRLDPRRGRALLRVGGWSGAIGACSLALIVYAHGEAFRFMSEEPAEFPSFERLYERFHDGMPMIGLLAPLLNLGLLLVGIGALRAGLPKWAGLLLVAVPILLLTAGPALSPQLASIVIGVPLVVGLGGISRQVAAAAAPTAEGRFVL